MSSMTEGLAAASCSWPCNGPFSLPGHGAFEASGLASRPVIPHEQFVKTPTTPSGPLSSSLCSAAAREPCYPAAQLDAFHPERPLLILQQAVELGARGVGAEQRGPAPSHPQAAAQSTDPPPQQQHDVGAFCFAQRAMEIDRRFGSGENQREIAPASEEQQAARRRDAAEAAVREGKWTKEEHKAFLEGYAQHGKSWRDIAAMVPTRTPEQIRTHAQKYFQKHDKPKRLKGESMGACMSRGAAVGVPLVPMSGPAAQQSRMPASLMDLQFRPFTLSAPPSLVAQDPLRPPQTQPSYLGASQMMLPPHPPPLTLSMSAPSCGITEQSLQTFNPPSPSRFRSMSEGTTLSSTATAGSALSILIKELEESQPQDQAGRKVQAEMSDYDSPEDSEDECQMEEDTDESDEDDHLVVMARQPLGRGQGHHYGDSSDEDDDEHEDDDDDDMEVVDALRHQGDMDSASELETEHGFDEPFARPPQRSGAKPRIREGRWTREEHQLFLRAYKYYGKAWKEISHTVCTRTPEQIRTHAQKYFAKQSRMRTLNRSRGPHGDDESSCRPSGRSASSSLTSSHHGHGHGHSSHLSSSSSSISSLSHTLSHGPRRALSHNKSSSSTSSLSSAGSRITARTGSPLSTATSSATMSMSSFDMDGASISGSSSSSSSSGSRATGSPRLTSRQLACAAAKHGHGAPRRVGSNDSNSSSSNHMHSSACAVSVSVPEAMMTFDHELMRTGSEGGSSSPGGSSSTIRTVTTNESNESEEDLELDEEEMKSLDDDRDEDCASKLGMGGPTLSSSSSSSSSVSSSTSQRKPPNEGRWTKEEHMLFLEGLKRFGKSWKDIQTLVKTRTPDQIRTHAQKYFIKLDKYGNSTTTATQAQVSFNGHPLVLMDGRRAGGAGGPMAAEPVAF